MTRLGRPAPKTGMTKKQMKEIGELWRAASKVSTELLIASNHLQEIANKLYEIWQEASGKFDPAAEEGEQMTM